MLVTDRYSAYNWYPVRWRQLCWAHLLRDFAGDAGPWGRLPGSWGGLAEAGIPDVYVVASGARGYLTTLHVSVLHDSGAPRGIMDIRAGRWGGTNQEYGRAGDPSRSAVAQGERWHAEGSWLPFCRKHADGGVDVATTAAPCLGVSHRRLCSSAPWGSGSISAPHKPS